MTEMEMGANSAVWQKLMKVSKRRKVVLLNSTALFVLSVIVSLLLPKWYSSKAVIIASGRAPIDFLSMASGIPLADLGLGTVSEEISNYVAILNSRAVRETVVHRFDLVNRYRAKDVEFALKELGQNVGVKVNQEGALEIEALDRDPVVARDMVRAFLEELNTVNYRLSSEKGKLTREFLERRVQENRDDLKRAEEDLRAFQKKYGIVELSSQVASTIEVYAQLYAQLIDAEMKLKLARATYPENDPRILQLQTLHGEMSQKLASLSTEGESSRILLGFSRLPDRGLELVRLIREVETQKKIMEVLLPQYEQAKMDETKNIPTVQVIDPPVVALNKTYPRRTLIVISTTLMAVMFSVLYVLAEDKIRRVWAIFVQS